MGLREGIKALLGMRVDEPRGVGGQITHHINMRRWGVQDKVRYGDNLEADQGQYNRPLMRPAYSRFALNRTMRFVAPGSKTPWPSVNWVPTPPHRTQQLTKSGGRQPQSPGMLTAQMMAQSTGLVPLLQTGLSSYADRRSTIQAGGYYGSSTG